MISWALQGNLRNPHTAKRIEAALIRQQVPYSWVKLVPFSEEIPESLLNSNDANLICWGASFVPRMVAYTDICPGIWFNLNSFKWSSFYTHWGDAMLSRNAKTVPASEAFHYLSEKPSFVRPDGDTKSFSGGLFSAEEFSNLMRKKRIDEDVVVAPPILVDAEWRNFVVNGSVIAASTYRTNNKANIMGFIPPEITRFAESVANLWSPAPVYCLDIGFAEGRLGVIEANCFNASRHYGANTNKIVGAVTQFAASTI